MKNFIKSLMLISAILIVAGCQEDFTEINTNPNGASEVPASFLITTAMKSNMDYVWDEWANGRFGLLYAQYWAQNQYSDESRFLFRPGVINNYWNYYYAGRGVTATDRPGPGGGIVELEEVIKINTDNNIGDVSSNQIAIARILKAWMFQIMTDVWGDIPYTEAFAGTENRTPAYDTQRDIYMDLMNELNGAIGQIVEGASAFGTSDLVYGDDMAKWKKFANSLKMRVAIRMADVEPAMAEAAINEAWAGAFTSNGDNAMMRYLAAQPNNNPLHEDRISRFDADFGFSKTMTDIMIPSGDPRLPKYADPAQESGGFVGMPYGLEEDNANAIQTTVVSMPSGAAAVRGEVPFKATDVLNPEAPGVLMDYAEVEFILAEAAQRGWIASDAGMHYENAIRASMEYWEVTDQQAIDDYIMGNPYDAVEWKQSLGLQKWLAMYMQGIQGWTEWRRLDFDVLVMPESIAIGTGIPVRRPYPSDESTLNGTNLQVAVANQGMTGAPDQLSTKVWWDVN